MFGPDVPASLTTEEFATLVEGVRFIETATANPVDKDALVADMSRLRSSFMRSPVTTSPLPAGHRLTEADLALKKPGTGLPPQSLGELVGRTLRQDVPADHLLSYDDLEDAT
jgi:N-acetylneuraminate synthase